MFTTVSALALLSAVWATALPAIPLSADCVRQGPDMMQCEFKAYAEHAMQRTRPLYPEVPSPLTFGNYDEAVALDETHGASALVISRKTWALVADNTVYAYASSEYNKTLHNLLGVDDSPASEKLSSKEKRDHPFSWRRPPCRGGPCDEPVDCAVFNCEYCFPMPEGIGKCTGSFPAF